jgi:gliding motility-associated-like protein
MIKVSFLLGLTALFGLSAAAQQGLYISDGELTIQSGATVTIQGDLSSESAASIANFGTVRLRDNLVNNGGNTLFTTQNDGLVLLYGNNQLIAGADSTVFHDLTFGGAVYAEKSFLQPSSVLNQLNINNQVMQTNGNRVFLINDATGALSFNAGYISSDLLGGYFVRATGSTDEYIFPVGADNLTPNYRAVIVAPLSPAPAMYEVRLAPVGAQNDNSGISATGAVGAFDINAKTPDLGTLNPVYYHNIHRLQGAGSADIDVFFRSNDGPYFTLAQWKTNQFENPTDQLAIANDFGLDRVVSLKNFSDYNDDVFVLASADTIPEEPCTEFFFPTIFSPNGDGNNDNLCVFWGCLTSVELTIYNRWGEVVFFTEDEAECWNGEQNGQPVNTGSFVYVINAVDSETGEEVTYSGNLTLSR